MHTRHKTSLTPLENWLRVVSNNEHSVVKHQWINENTLLILFNFFIYFLFGKQTILIISSIRNKVLSLIFILWALVNFAQFIDWQQKLYNILYIKYLYIY